MRSQLLTRSWVFTPPYLHHRAGKHCRSHTTLTYRVFAEIPHHNIPRSTEPYQMRNSYPERPILPPNTVNKPKRPFGNPYRGYSSASAASNSKIPHISVHIAASSSGKGTKYRPEKSTYNFDRKQTPPALGLQSSGQTIYQKRRGRPDSGQDAYFVATVNEKADQHTIAFGVCDGVGGWADHGIDPADFSHGMCSYMAKTALEWPEMSSKPDEKLVPQNLLDLAYTQVIKDPEVKAGGSTACVGIVDGNGRVSTANLGDSGFLQLRPGAVCTYSNPQTHAFNTPYQMSLTPPEMLAQAMIFGGLPLNDHPDRADISHLDLKHGDVLILATDGVWDNLSSQDLLTSVSNTMRNVGAWKRTEDRGYVATDKLTEMVNKESASKAGLPGTLQSVIAATICGEAKTASMNRKRDGPFAKAWQLHAPYDPYHGGKVDDITVLVLLSVSNQTDNGGDGTVKAKL